MCGRLPSRHRYVQALLVHAALVCADHEEALMGQHCTRLLVNLLYATSAR